MQGVREENPKSRCFLLRGASPVMLSNHSVTSSSDKQIEVEKQKGLAGNWREVNSFMTE